MHKIKKNICWTATTMLLLFIEETHGENNYNCNRNREYNRKQKLGYLFHNFAFFM